MTRMKSMKSKVALGSAAAVVAGGLAFAGFAGAESHDDAASHGPITFEITVENLSGPDAITTSAGTAVPNPLSPPVWAVYRGTNPLFTAYRRADQGTARIAEDGFPEKKVKMLSRTRRVSSSGVILQEGGPLGPAFEPGSSATAEITARDGDWFQFEAMFVQSNDYFYALGGDGIPLFSPDGTPISGDVTKYVNVWDAGTELDEEPGNGRFQKPNQGPEQTNYGPSTREPVVPQANTGDPWEIPSPTDLIKITITPKG